MKSPVFAASVLIAAVTFAQAPPQLVPPGAQPPVVGTPAATQPRLNLEVTFQKKIFNVKPSLATEEAPVNSDPQAYVVTIKNNGPAELSGTKIEYRYYLSGVARGETGSEPEMKRKEGAADPGTLAVGESFSFTTDTFDVPRSTPRGGYFYYADGSRTRFKADLAGIWLRIMRGSTIVFERAEPASITTRDPF
ncbi:hypothetical protein AYO41_01315 [Verrucomicrobia bacterium SCGC AG-212-E04]|nr:hypothetical protein AYO41_01315 [Verrucomicrobia bacterium SCGC AG-212-E04]